MAPRNRYQFYPTHKGKVVTGGVLAAGGDYDVEGGHAACGDQTGPGDCAPFSVHKLTMDGGRVNVFNSPGNYWEDYRVDWFDVTSFSHLGSLQDKLDNDYAAQACARTNPSRPYVDIPVNILELGDIARTIRRVGVETISQLGRQNLRYQFGIVPLVSDLVKLANFQDQVARRILELDRLQSQRGLRRTVPLDAWTEATSYDVVLQSNQYFWTGTISQTTMALVKGHVRWLPDSNYAPMTLSDRQRLAFRSVLGLTFDSSTVWEAIPWSWLIDWCSNVGQFMAAHRNIVPATLSGVHIMRETKSWFQNPGAAGLHSAINVQLVTKTRNPAAVIPVAHFPFLSAGQMGILGSLAVTRR